MKVSIKLKPDEARALVEVFERVLPGEPCSSRMDAIIAFMMLRLYAHLKKKTVMLDKAFTLTLQPDMAMAYVEFFYNIPIDTTSFSGFVVQRCMNQFDQKTAEFF